MHGRAKVTFTNPSNHVHLAYNLSANNAGYDNTCQLISHDRNRGLSPMRSTRFFLLGGRI